jgi:hypothetical protein
VSAHTTAEHRERSTAPREPGFLLTSFALFGGIALWMVHLVASTALVRPACDHSLTWLLNTTTVVTGVGAAAAAAAGWRIRRHYVAGEGIHVGRMLLLADLAIIFGIASVALIALEGYPVLVIDSCSA